MRKKSKFQDLMVILNDIDRQSKLSPTYAIFHRDKIQEFKKSNSERIAEFYARMDQITQKYALLNPTGQPTMGQKDGEPMILFKDDTAKDAFQKEYWALLGEEIYLTL